MHCVPLFLFLKMVKAALSEAEDLRSVVRELEAEILKLKAEKNIIFLEIQNLKVCLRTHF